MHGLLTRTLLNLQASPSKSILLSLSGHCSGVGDNGQSRPSLLVMSGSEMSFFIWVDEPPPRDPNGSLIDELNDKLRVAEQKVNSVSMQLEDYKSYAAKTRRSSLLAWGVIWLYIVAWSVSELLSA